MCSFWEGTVVVEFQRAPLPIKEAFLAADKTLLYPQFGFRVNSHNGYYRVVITRLDITRDLLRDFQLAAAAVEGGWDNKVSERPLSGLTLTNLLSWRIPDARRFDAIFTDERVLARSFFS